VSHEQAVCRFDVARVPFSRFGSWMSISIPRREQELTFRNHHGGENNLFPLQALASGQVVRPQIEAEPWRLRLRHGAGQIEIGFDSPRTVRLRGRGLGLQLGGKNIAYSEGPNLVTLNKPRTRRYQVEMLRGAIALRQQVPGQAIYPLTAVLTPAEDGRWEAAIDEYTSTWQRPPRPAFDQALAAARRDFEAFLEAMPAVRPPDEAARALAAYVNWSSVVEPCGLLRRPTMLMSKNWMCNVWSWDQCFNALALARGLPELALDQMLVLADHQDEFGAYFDAANDVLMHYNFSKPPVHGLIFRELLRRAPRPPAAKLLRTMYDSLGRQADWWLTHRRRPGQRLPYYLHGNDSGWDNSTMFDGGVPLAAPDLAALLVAQLDALAELAAALGRTTAAARWRQRAAELQQALLEELWRGDHFVARRADTGAVVESQSLIPWLPIVLGRRLPKPLRAALHKGLAQHLTAWGLATEKPSSPQYRADGYWRGPIWAPATWLAVTGLDRCGYGELADTIANRFCRLCARSGFAENFEARTGKPLCDPAYTWTASVFLLLAERMRRRAARSGGRPSA